MTAAQCPRSQVSEVLYGYSCRLPRIDARGVFKVYNNNIRLKEEHSLRVPHDLCSAFDPLDLFKVRHTQIEKISPLHRAYQCNRSMRIYAPIPVLHHCKAYASGCQVFAPFHFSLRFLQQEGKKRRRWSGFPDFGMPRLRPKSSPRPALEMIHDIDLHVEGSSALSQPTATERCHDGKAATQSTFASINSEMFPLSVAVWVELWERAHGVAWGFRGMTSQSPPWERAAAENPPISALPLAFLGFFAPSLGLSAC